MRGESVKKGQVKGGEGGKGGIKGRKTEEGTGAPHMTCLHYAPASISPI